MVPSSSAAAQPMTTVRSAERRPRRRTKLRSFRSLAAVTVQELTTATSACAGSSTTVAPRAANAWRTTSVSY